MDIDTYILYMELRVNSWGILCITCLKYGGID